MKSIPLGKKIKTISIYNPKLLFPIPRKEYREKINIRDIYFNGYDIWNAYELSWLNNYGKPEVRILQITYSYDSDNIVESKSLKSVARFKETCKDFIKTSLQSAYPE